METVAVVIGVILALIIALVVVLYLISFVFAGAAVLFAFAATSGF